MYLHIGGVSIRSDLRTLEMCAARLPPGTAQDACDAAVDDGIAGWHHDHPEKIGTPTYAYEQSAVIEVSVADAVAIRVAFDEGR